MSNRAALPHQLSANRQPSAPARPAERRYMVLIRCDVKQVARVPKLGTSMQNALPPVMRS